MNVKNTPALSPDEKDILLRLAREAIEAAVAVKPLPRVDLDRLPPSLSQPGACFVTLYQHGDLRGCTGTLLARTALAYEVVQTAAQTALYDPRFMPVSAREVESLEIEISILTPPTTLDVPAPDALPGLLRPGIDGVTLYKGAHRATFLPQVWDKIPDPIEFLDMLCQKMGLPRKEWIRPGMKVEIYQVEEFAEHTVAG